MTNFEKLQGMFSDIDFCAKFLNELESEEVPCKWDCWFEAEYCSNCLPEDNELWCMEHNGKCRFFENKAGVPTGYEKIKLWLENECEIKE